MIIVCSSAGHITLHDGCWGHPSSSTEQSEQLTLVNLTTYSLFLSHTLLCLFGHSPTHCWYFYIYTHTNTKSHMHPGNCGGGWVGRLGYRETRGVHRKSIRVESCDGRQAQVVGRRTTPPASCCAARPSRQTGDLDDRNKVSQSRPSGLMNGRLPL